MKNKYRVKTSQQDQKDPYYSAQVKVEGRGEWMTIYPKYSTNSNFVLFCNDSEHAVCRFDNFEFAAAQCKMYEKWTNPQIVVTYTDVKV